VSHHRAKWLLILLPALGSCSALDSGSGFEDRRAFDPPLELYTTWWTELEACAARTADFGRIDWFLAGAISDPTEPNIDPRGIRGQWRSNHEITILADHQGDFRVVKHEMLHDLLDGDREHASKFWGLCDAHEGMPADTILVPGRYEYSLRFTEDLQDRRFEGVLEIATYSGRTASGSWEGESADGTSRFSSEPWSVEWEYNGYFIPGEFEGERTGSVRNRILRVEGVMRCAIARVGRRQAPCSITPLF